MLYGDTALALRLGHRQSVDFHFFGTSRFEPSALIASVPLLASATITQQAPDILSVMVDREGPIKLSFFGVPRIGRVQPADRADDNGLQVASLLDLAGTKAFVVQQRAEAKDYIDIDAILTDGRIDSPLALAAAQAIYGEQFNPLTTLKALSFFDDGDLRHLPKSARDRLVATSRQVNLGRLPALPRMARGHHEP
ncbi:nucleotidyl transferase AbiEii/AbiGii toxin family protein [Rhodopila sp.]|uniref:nucleotidyl transferase AbiEii/AbiGii toxin family protein n=1 Tax=Rhodopila sp. TaxID=2480087 RepID=UPI003D0C023B